MVEVHLENARKRSKVYLEVVCPTCPLAEVKLGGTLAFHYGTLLNSESLACWEKHSCWGVGGRTCLKAQESSAYIEKLPAKIWERTEIQKRDSCFSGFICWLPIIEMYRRNTDHAVDNSQGWGRRLKLEAWDHQYDNGGHW